MIQTSNPDNILCFRASMRSELMTNPRGKSPAEKYQEASEKLVKYRDDYHNMVNKMTKSAIAKDAQITKTEKLVEELSAKKDEPFFSETFRKSVRNQWLTWKYGRFRSIDNKFTKKGKMVEEQGITIASMNRGVLFQKNDIRLYDLQNFMTGEPDIFIGESIMRAKETNDIKCSWDIQTFYDSLSSKLKPVYDYQGLDYMHLTGADVHKVCFCLVNTPYDIVVDEIKKETFGMWDAEMPKWREMQILTNHVYEVDTFRKYMAGLDIDPMKDGKEVQAVFESFIPLSVEERYFEHVVERDDDRIRNVIERSHMAMEYVKSELETGKFRKQIISSEDEIEE